MREIASYQGAEEFEDLSDSLAELIRDKELQGKPVEAKPNPTLERPKESDTGVFAAVPVPKKVEGAPATDSATKEIPVVGAAPMDGATKEIPVVGAAPLDGATKEIPIVGAAPMDGATKEIPIVGAAPASPGLEHMKTKAFRLEEGEEDPGHTRTFDGLVTSDIALGADTASDMTVVNIPTAPPADEEDEDEDGQEIYLHEEEEEADDVEKPKTVLTSRGKAFFWGIAVATSPVTIVAALLVLAVFALGIVTVCASMVLCLLLVCAFAVAGSALALVGIIYGGIEIVSGHIGIGLYEIGLGICCGGLALCLGILTFNLAVVALPYVLKQVITFEGYCLKRVGPMLERFREECNGL
ncbi:MAG: hypothetical protein IJD22_06260 [Clostridia bacterium]|nr:hypothetical protein [Clostridia bacterium]